MTHCESGEDDDKDEDDDEEDEEEMTNHRSKTLLKSRSWQRLGGLSCESDWLWGHCMITGIPKMIVAKF